MPSAFAKQNPPPTTIHLNQLKNVTKHFDLEKGKYFENVFGQMCAKPQNKIESNDCCPINDGRYFGLMTMTFRMVATFCLHLFCFVIRVYFH